MNKNIKDETAAFIILVCMVITFSLTIGTWQYVRYTKLSTVNSNIVFQPVEENISATNEEFATITDITSQEDLEKVEKIKKEDKKLEESQEKDNKNNVNESYSKKYYIKVNYGAQVVTIYTKDANGKYTVPVKAMVCSTGTHTPTSGKYKIGYRWQWLKMIGDVYGHYVTQINGNILFHSVPYITKGDLSSLEYWEYDKLGSKASLGCVRLKAIDALWIYNNIGAGTIVEFYSSSNPGPLGKPSAKKISNAPKNVRGWDPTDPNKNNPWPEYLKKTEEDKAQGENNNPANENNINTNEITDESAKTNNTANGGNTNVVENGNTVNSNTVINELDKNITINEPGNNTDTNIVTNNTEQKLNANTTDNQKNNTI